MQLPGGIPPNSGGRPPVEQRQPMSSGMTGVPQITGGSMQMQSYAMPASMPALRAGVRYGPRPANYNQWHRQGAAAPSRQRADDAAPASRHVAEGMSSLPSALLSHPFAEICRAELQEIPKTVQDMSFGQLCVVVSLLQSLPASRVWGQYVQSAFTAPVRRRLMHQVQTYVKARVDLSPDVFEFSHRCIVLVMNDHEMQRKALEDMAAENVPPGIVGDAEKRQSLAVPPIRISRQDLRRLCHFVAQVFPMFIGKFLDALVVASHARVDVCYKKLHAGGIIVDDDHCRALLASRERAKERNQRYEEQCRLLSVSRRCAMAAEAERLLTRRAGPGRPKGSGNKQQAAIREAPDMSDSPMRFGMEAGSFGGGRAAWFAGEMTSPEGDSSPLSSVAQQRVFRSEFAGSALAKTLAGQGDETAQELISEALRKGREEALVKRNQAVLTREVTAADVRRVLEEAAVYPGSLWEQATFNSGNGVFLSPSLKFRGLQYLDLLIATGGQQPVRPANPAGAAQASPSPMSDTPGVPGAPGGHAFMQQAAAQHAQFMGQRGAMATE